MKLIASLYKGTRKAVSSCLRYGAFAAVALLGCILAVQSALPSYATGGDPWDTSTTTFTQPAFNVADSINVATSFLYPGVIPVVVIAAGIGAVFWVLRMVFRHNKGRG